jgi:hypothetical protein
MFAAVSDARVLGRCVDEDVRMGFDRWVRERRALKFGLAEGWTFRKLYDRRENHNESKKSITGRFGLLVVVGGSDCGDCPAEATCG